MEILPAGTVLSSQRRSRPELTGSASPAGLQVYQLSQDDGAHNSHVYMESHVFTPDSKRFVYERIPLEASWRRYSQYMLCDLEDGSLRALTDEENAVACAVTHDGSYMYYLVDDSVLGGGRIALRRVSLDSFARETVVVIDSPLGDEGYRPSRPYRLGAISSDDRRFATSAYLGDGETEDAPFGLLVFDLEDGEAWVVELGAAFCNAHPQYCRHPEAPYNRDVLVQHNHGSRVDPSGQRSKLVSGAGADIHVVQDDGADWRLLPWGRTRDESCQGHQAWRGKMPTAVTSTRLRGKAEDERRRASLSGEDRGVMGASGEPAAGLVEGLPMEVSWDRLHDGAAVPGVEENRNDADRHIVHPNFCHFAFDPTGTRFVTDTYGYGGHAPRLYIGTLPAEENAAMEVAYLLHPGSSFGKPQYTHPHPFVSPNAEMVFFNSDVDGTTELFMATGFSYPEE